jgi:receptor expression-enhancing protein 5/6
VLAVESAVTHDDTEWLIYWIVYASFGFVEYIGYAFFNSLPLYWLIKCLFLIWLMAPGEKGGSHVIYHRIVRPFVLKHHPVIDQHIRDGKFFDLRPLHRSAHVYLSS